MFRGTSTADCCCINSSFQLLMAPNCLMPFKSTTFCTFFWYHKKLFLFYMCMLLRFVLTILQFGKSWVQTTYYWYHWYAKCVYFGHKCNALLWYGVNFLFSFTENWDLYLIFLTVYWCYYFKTLYSVDHYFDISFAGKTFISLFFLKSGLPRIVSV